MFLTSLKQTCNEYLIKFSENQSAPKLENRKTSPCSPCAPNLLHMLVSRILGYHNLCSPVTVIRGGGGGESIFSKLLNINFFSECYTRADSVLVTQGRTNEVGIVGTIAKSLMIMMLAMNC